MKKLNLRDVLCDKRFKEIAAPYFEGQTQNQVMKKKLKSLIEKIRSGQSGFDNILVMDTSGPQKEDAIH